MITEKNHKLLGKNHTTGYSQDRWEMIWHFALCSSNFSVASGGLYETQSKGGGLTGM
jgi:hypothetical protein